MTDSVEMRLTNSLMSFDTGIRASNKWLSWLTMGSHDETAGKKAFPSIVFRVSETNATVNLFATGRAVVGGLNSDFHTMLTADWICYLINTNLPPDATQMAVVRRRKCSNDVYAIDLGRRIRIYDLYYDNKLNTKKTGRFDSIRMRFGSKKKGFTVTVFGTGKLNIIGIRDRTCVDAIRRRIHRVFANYLE